MTYEAWRITYQSSEQAARAAYAQVERLTAEVNAKSEAYRDNIASWMQNYGDKAAECHELSGKVEQLEREVAVLQTLVPHPGDGTCDRCGTGGAVTITAAMCEECRELEREIAYHAARSDIECYCEGHRESGPYAGTWYCIESPESDDEKEFVEKAVRYLEFRKLLKRHPKNPDLVKPMDAEAVRP